MRWVRRMAAWGINIFFGRFERAPSPRAPSSISEAKAAIQRADADAVAVDRIGREAQATSAGFQRLRARNALGDDITAAFNRMSGN